MNRRTRIDIKFLKESEMPWIRNPLDEIKFIENHALLSLNDRTAPDNHLYILIDNKYLICVWWSEWGGIDILPAEVLNRKVK